MPNIPHRAYHAESTHMVFCWLSKKNRVQVSKHGASKTNDEERNQESSPADSRPGKRSITEAKVKLTLWNLQVILTKRGKRSELVCTCGMRIRNFWFLNMEYGKQIVENMPFHQKMVSR